MPTNHPYGDKAVPTNVYTPLAVCALVLGTAVLFLDYHSGAPSNRGFLLVVGLVSLAAAVALGIAASVTHRDSDAG